MSQITGNATLPTDTLTGTFAPWAAPSSSTIGAFPAGSPGTRSWMNGAGSDGVRPAWFGGSGTEALSSVDSSLFGGATSMMAGGSSIASILSSLSSLVQQYIGKLGNALLGSQSSTTTAQATANAGPATTFQNVALGSVGDPHLSVTGTSLNASGTSANVDSHYDSMTSHADLFSTHDFHDGFNVSTTVTTPASNGVTQNASATVSMDDGLDGVTMNANGSVSITSGGAAVAIAAGQSVQLANGATVTEAANGSVSIAEARYGSNLTTTFTANGGGGVDVTASGANVSLAGDLVNKR
jgi:hypothetical protein